MAGRGLRCRAGKADAPAQHPQSCPILWLWLLQPIVSVQQPRVGQVVNKDAAKHEHVTGSGVVIRISISFHHDFLSSSSSFYLVMVLFLAEEKFSVNKINTGLYDMFDKMIIHHSFLFTTLVKAAKDAPTPDITTPPWEFLEDQRGTASELHSSLHSFNPVWRFCWTAGGNTTDSTHDFQNWHKKYLCVPATSSL